MDQDMGNENISEEEKKIMDRYNLNDYDDDEDLDNTALNHSELVVFADNNQDPYLNHDEAFSDVSHFKCYRNCCLFFCWWFSGWRWKEWFQNKANW